MDDNLLKQDEQVKQEVKLAENLNVTDEQKNLYVPLTPAEVVREQTATKSRLSAGFKKASDRKISLKKIDKNSVVKSVTRVTKKNFLKADETVTENIHYYGTSEKLLEQRSENAELLKAGRFAVKDVKADYRIDTDIKVKSAVGYQAFMQLSQFFPAMIAEGMSKDAFNDMVKKYGKKEGVPDRFEVMDKLAGKIMGINPSDFDMSSDKAIASKSSVFENMNSMVSAYREMLEDNPHYIEHLKKTKDENDNKNYYDKLIDQLNILSTMTDYYRIRKMIMSDSEYILRGGDIEQEVKETDSKGTRHLKEMLRASYHIASNLNRLLGVNEIEPVELSSGKSKFSQKINDGIDKTFVIDEKDIEDVKVKKNITTSGALLLREDKIRDELDRLEREADGIADISMRDCLGKLTDISRTVYDPKTKSYKKVKHATSFVGIYGGVNNTVLNEYSINSTKARRKNADELEARIRRIANMMYNGSLSHDARFDSKKYPELKQMDISDNIARMIHKYMLEVCDDMSDSEIVEYIETQIQSIKKDYFNRYDADKKRKEGKKLTEEEKQLEPISKEEYEYYEEAYIDVAMKSIYRHNALFERLDQALGGKAFILHPVDFAIKFPEQAAQLLTSYTTITNIVERDNKTSTERLKGFIEKYNRDYKKNNKYKINADNFVNSADVFGSMLFKMNSYTYVSKYITMIYNDQSYDDIGFNPDFSEEQYDEIKSDVGKMGITKQKIDLCYEEHKNDEMTKLLALNKKINEVPGQVSAELKVAVYLYNHPEVLNSRLMNHISDHSYNTLNLIQPKSATTDAYEHGGYLMNFTYDELKEYEEDLKRRKMKPTNVDIAGNLLDENDPYGLKVFYEMLEEEEGKIKRT